MPISCENCRRRKIRCLSSDERAPCDTCLRRGYAFSCRFRKESIPKTPTPNDDLTKQIPELLDLLKQNISITSASLDRRRGSEDSPLQRLEADTLITPARTEETGSEMPPSGRLLTSPSNHVRYVSFDRVGDANLVEMMQEPVSDLFSGSFFLAQDPKIHQSLLHTLPPPRVCDELIETYLNVFSPLLHILHEPTFKVKYQKMKTDPQSAPLPFLGLMFVIFSLAVTSFQDENTLIAELSTESSHVCSVRNIAAQYRSIAMRCLAADNFMIQNNLCTLQCLILLIYAIGHAGGPTWSLLGTTLHIAIGIGCSVDPDNLDVSIIEGEERRRSWAALLMLYKIQSTCIGTTMPIHVQTDVTLPADVDDEDLLDSTRDSPQFSPHRLTQMSYILCKFRLCNLAFDICRLSSSTQLPSRALTEKFNQLLEMELSKHMSLFETVTNMPLYHVAHFYIVSSYIHHLFLLLHRPYLGADETADSDQSLAAHIRESRQRCNDSAMKILSNFESFFRNKNLKVYHWYLKGLGSFQSFLAITTLMVLMAKRNTSATTKLAMRTAIRTCWDIFSQMAPTSQTSAKALTVLECFVQSPLSEFQQVAFDQAHFTSPFSSNHNAIADTWNFLPQVEDFLHAIPSEQWLLPSEFPWGGARQL
ncbi:hypothetical protein PENPOL_c002G08725 [Penicillium polonicum]|uniref:Zn(2)-C6 fungal-type domain-containing protein n=1 Tax=Penicillium polonicum TaxID=60169 RepID=A0A1V6NZD0_PENPO|nr:hypothetical protein PENPOL_c002G08725 [Penicillium polonicum]